VAGKFHAEKRTPWFRRVQCAPRKMVLSRIVLSMCASRPHVERDVHPDMAVDKLIRACSVEPPWSTEMTFRKTAPGSTMLRTPRGTTTCGHSPLPSSTSAPSWYSAVSRRWSSTSSWTERAPDYPMCWSKPQAAQGLPPGCVAHWGLKLPCSQRVRPRLKKSRSIQPVCDLPHRWGRGTRCRLDWRLRACEGTPHTGYSCGSPPSRLRDQCVAAVLNDRDTARLPRSRVAKASTE